MSKSDNLNLPIYDNRGKPLELAYHVTYTLRLKNGYILALKPGEHIVRMPNLLATDVKRRA
ncbi:hypothetical protein ACFQ5M_04765 [Agrilactobacillus yilanensis]|uniref:Uncharacterized protein n=1 Tax=Agrilactobacillus yilanensis TaxID=2485997 RepID=A0ABW4J5D4_9LACO|nr:hypothetical protein [Agrilactobacillus yilanensis]